MDKLSAFPCAGDGLAPHALPAFEPWSSEGCWQLLLAVRHAVDSGKTLGGQLGFSALEGDWVRDRPERADIVLEVDAEQPGRGRERFGAPARELLDLHLAHALSGRARGHRVGMLGQSLDGFIATREGHSRYINGPESLIHLHRLRALSDAVVIGIGTAVADGPRLTTRHCPGPHPVRVVIDPQGRLPGSSGLLHDGLAPTLVIRAGEEREAVPVSAQAEAICLPADENGIAPARIVEALAARGLTRLLIEGGGFTVTRFLTGGLLDRVHLAISPLLMGDGRPALRIEAVRTLDEAPRPPSRRFIMGDDVLVELVLARAHSTRAETAARP